MEEINELIKKVDFSDFSTVKNFINNVESGMYNGKFDDGKEFILMVQKGKELSIHQESNNPKIAKVDMYQIDEDEPNGIIYSEMYEPVGK